MPQQNPGFHTWRELGFPADFEPRALGIRCSRCGWTPTRAEFPLTAHDWIRVADAPSSLWVCPGCRDPEDKPIDD
jgi:hypothetical protein